MPKKSKEVEQNKNPILLKPREEVSNFLLERIKIGQSILQKEIRSEEDLNDASREKEKWHKFNLEYLKHCFEGGTIAEDYEFSGSVSMYLQPSFGQVLESIKQSLRQSISELESINERLNIFQEKYTKEPSRAGISDLEKNKIFIVHGHDEALKHKVARFVAKLGLEGIILDEQANVGMTIIEKFEAHAQSARYAIVLLTHDDMGYPKNSPSDVKPRARQNAIAELGYFLRALGRENMAILCSDNIEIPSDFNGVLYLPVRGDEWELRLAKEMRASGLNIDLNKL